MGKYQQEADLLAALYDTNKLLEAESEARKKAEEECNEQARLLGMSAERELTVMARLEEANKKLAEAQAAILKYEAITTDDLLSPYEELEAIKASDYQRGVDKYKPWYDAITDACVIHFVDWDETDPRASVTNLVNYANLIALDPQVSGDAQALIQRGRDEVMKELEGQEAVGHFVLNTESGYWHQLDNQAWPDGSPKSKKLYTRPAPIPAGWQLVDTRNIHSISQDSDMTVSFTFSSCRAAGDFKAMLEAAKGEKP